MDDIARACIEDGNWNPLIQVHLFLFCQAYFDYLFDINETYVQIFAYRSIFFAVTTKLICVFVFS